MCVCVNTRTNTGTKRFRFVLSLHKHLKRRRGESPFEIRVRRSNHLFEDTLVQMNAGYYEMMRRRLNVTYEDEIGAGIKSGAT